MGQQVLPLANLRYVIFLMHIIDWQKARCVDRSSPELDITTLTFGSQAIRITIGRHAFLYSTT